VSLAAALARYWDDRVLLVDCDPQGNSTDWMYTDPLKAELATVLTGVCSLKDAIVPATAPGLSLLPTAGLGGGLKVWDEGVGLRKPLAFRNLKDKVDALGYRFCIFDLSPGFGAVERAALIGSDEVITPIMPDPFGISGLEIFTANLTAYKEDMRSIWPEYRRIVVNAVDGRIKQHAEILEKVKAGSEGLMLYTLPVDQVFRRAQTEHRSIFEDLGAKKETIEEIERMAIDFSGEV